MSRRSDGRRIARVSSHGPPCGKEATTRRRRSRVLLFLLTNQPPKNPAAYKELRHKSRNRPIHGALIALQKANAQSFSAAATCRSSDQAFAPFAFRTRRDVEPLM